MSKELKIIFAGTPEIASDIMAEILKYHNIQLVITQSDKPAGRGKKLTASPVKKLALQNNIPIIQPSTLKNLELFEIIKKIEPDIMIVVAFGFIIPAELLLIPKYGCINIHVSLLPKFRGAAPIQRAIQMGETTTGITIIKMDTGLDTGDILMQKKIAITSKDTTLSLSQKLITLAKEMIIVFLKTFQSITPIKQTTENISYAPKILKNESKINWQEDATIIDRKVRAFNPQPGCFTFLDNILIKIWQVTVCNNLSHNNLTTGTITVKNNKIYVACGNNSILEIEILQVAGKKPQSANLFLIGCNNIANKIFN